MYFKSPFLERNLQKLHNQRFTEENYFTIIVRKKYFLIIDLFSFRKISGDQSPPGRVELEDSALCHRVKQEEEEEDDEGGDRLDVVGGIEDSLIKGDYVIKTPT